MSFTATVEGSQRILIIDDNPRIHEDIRKILSPDTTPDDLAADEAALFGEAAAAPEHSRFEIDSAHQGQEGLAMVEKALAEKRPYSMAFVDLRMPPGWGGIETIQRIWQRDPGLQIVICTAYSDHSWNEIIRSLGKSDSLLILKKPFDNVEALQLAHALTKKWSVTSQASSRMASLESAGEGCTRELALAKGLLHAELARGAGLESKLREWEQCFLHLFETAPVPLAILKSDTLAHAGANQPYLGLIGHSREEVLEKTPRELGLPENPVAFEDIIKTLRSGQPVTRQATTLVNSAGETRRVLLSILPIPSTPGER